ncbi:MAG: type II toxin-antitoxin system VapC family toxin [Burkholderiaceae bacterium]|nr:type II toxin-antitoxin system VapC family toxin [Burkholderiaceae bacterium]
MIVDTSVVVALAAGEASTGWIRKTLDEHASAALRMSWVNIAECGMVLERAVSGSSEALESALAAIGIEALEADYSILRLAIDARARYPLNFGDCFAYAHARARNEPLLTLDRDFLATDLVDVLHPRARSRGARATR